MSKLSYNKWWERSIKPGSCHFKVFELYLWATGSCQTLWKQIDTSSDSVKNGLERGLIRRKEKSTKALPSPSFPLSNLHPNKQLFPVWRLLAVPEGDSTTILLYAFTSDSSQVLPPQLLSMNSLKHKYHNICPPSGNLQNSSQYHFTPVFFIYKTKW